MGKEKTAVSVIDIGISEKDRQKIAEGLSRLLADNYTLYLKTHNFHWNVKGPMFQTLHLMFMTQYNELWMALDEIAERIRALGFPAPGTNSEFARLTSIPETPGVPEAKEMIRLLVNRTDSTPRRCSSSVLVLVLELAGIGWNRWTGVDDTAGHRPG